MIKLIFLFIFLFAGCKTETEKKWGKLVKDGDYYFSTGEIEKAINCWIESLNYKKDISTYEKLIASFIIKNQLKQAEKYTISGLTYYPENVNLLFNLGIIKFYLEQDEESLKILNKVLEKNKYYPNIHYLKGLIYERKGQKERAKKEFIEEVNVYPGSKKAWKKIKEMKDEK